jgi:hypothetical protein
MLSTWNSCTCHLWITLVHKISVSYLGFCRGDRKCILSLMKTRPLLLNCKISCLIKFKQSPRPLLKHT